MGATWARTLTRSKPPSLAWNRVAGSLEPEGLRGRLAIDGAMAISRSPHGFQFIFAQ